MAAPFLWMVLGSFKTQGELLRVPPTWLPQDATTQNYNDLFNKADFPRYFLNSTLVALAVTAGQPDLLLDDRVRAGEARVHGPRRAVRRW